MKAPKNILDIIISNKTSLGDNPALPPELEEKFLVFLVNEHYNELLKHFDSIDIEELTQDLNTTLTECQRLESKSKEALEQLCYEVVNNIFNIPNDTIEIDMELVSNIDTKQERLTPENSQDFSFDSIEDMNNLTSEVYKRRLLNSLIVGAAMYYAEDVTTYSDKLVKIDGRLVSTYKKIMCINDLLLFHTKQNINGKQTDGGRVDVYLSNPETPVRIVSQGLIFPVLLEETIKGLLELSISHGLPESKEKAEYITSKADFKLAEVWDQRLGLPLWKRIVSLFDEIGEDPLDLGLNFIFMEIAQLKPKYFNAIMQEVLAGTKYGKKILVSISSKIRYNKERDEFDDYMSQKGNEGEYQINDEEFTSDELINDELCSKNILDETDY